MVKVNHIIILFFTALLLLVTAQHSNGQLLEDRGKLRTVKKERKGFFNFLRKRNKRTEARSSNFGSKPNIQSSSPLQPANFFQRLFDPFYQVPSPLYSPSDDKLYKGPPSPWRTKSPPPSNSNFTIPSRYRDITSKFNGQTSFHQGFYKGPSRGGEIRRAQKQSKDRSGVVINFRSTPMNSGFVGKYQGFDYRLNRSTQNRYYRELSREKSGLVIGVTPTLKNSNATHKYQGFDYRLSRSLQNRYDKELSRERSSLVIGVSPKFKSHNDTHKYQGFEKGRNKMGNRFYEKELSRERSGLVIAVTPNFKGHNDTHKYQGFERGRNKMGNRFYERELSRERSGLVIAVTPYFKSHNDTHKYQGFEKGRNKMGNRFYERELSRERSGLVVAVPPTFKDHNDTHNFKGFDKGRSKLGNWFYFNEVTRGQAKFEGPVKVMSYSQRLALANEQAAKMAEYHGGFKTRKRTNDMHPSASYVYGKRANSVSQKEFFRKLNVFWVRMNGNKNHPDAVTDQPKNPKYDKKEKDIWNY